MKSLSWLALVACFACTLPVFPHSGGLDASGCHAGSRPYHCHRSQNYQAPAIRPYYGLNNNSVTPRYDNRTQSSSNQFDVNSYLKEWEEKQKIEFEEYKQRAEAAAAEIERQAEQINRMQRHIFSDIPQSPTPVQRYLELNPTANLPSENVGQYTIRLDSLSSEQAAVKHWSNLQSLHPNIFSETTLEIEQAFVKGRLYYRMQSSLSTDYQRAENICQNLRLYGQYCLAVRRKN